jgi:hypothetical protein
MADRVGRLTLGWIIACGLLPDAAALSPGGPPGEDWKPVAYAARDPDTGVSWLKTNGYRLQQSDQPREFTFRGLRR